MGMPRPARLYLAAMAMCLAAGGAWLAVPGIFVAFGAFGLANAVMVEWLRRRAKGVLRGLERTGEAQAA